MHVTHLSFSDYHHGVEDIEGSFCVLVGDLLRGEGLEEEGGGGEGLELGEGFWGGFEEGGWGTKVGRGRGWE